MHARPLILFIWMASAQRLVIRDLQSDPLLIMKTIEPKIQIGNLKIIHPIDIKILEKAIDQLHTTLLTKMKEDSGFYTIIRNKIFDLYFKLNNIRPRRHRRWDQLGTAWKWLAGSPDADDLRLINTTMNELIDQHNSQFKINDAINHRLTLLTNSMNQLIEQSHQNMNDSLDIAGMKLLMNVNIIDEILSNIQDAILGAKMEMPSSRILTPNEMELVTETLLHQGIKLATLEEALTFVKPKVAVNQSQILYILQLPQISNTTATMLEIIPLPVQNQKIINSPTHLVHYESEFFTTKTPTTSVQKNADLTIFSDNCVKPLLRGKNSTCQTTFHSRTEVQLVSDNKILVTNARGEILTSNCGPDDKTIRGNILLTLNDCKVTIANSTYEVSDISLKTDVQGSFYDTLINVQEVKPFNISKIDDGAMNNTELLQNINLRQFDHSNFIHLLFGISILIGIGLIIVTLLIWNLKRVVKGTSASQRALTFEDLCKH